MRKKNKAMNRINVCEFIRASNRQVREAYKSRSLPQVAGDDCALFQMMTIMSPV